MALNTLFLLLNKNLMNSKKEREIMSLKKIYAKRTIGITELKRSDTDFIDNLDEPVAVLKRDKVKAYLISENLMAHFMQLVKYSENIYS
jgi:hypothetical protein